MSTRVFSLNWKPLCSSRVDCYTTLIPHTCTCTCSIACVGLVEALKDNLFKERQILMMRCLKPYFVVL